MAYATTHKVIHKYVNVVLLIHHHQIGHTIDTSEHKLIYEQFERQHFDPKQIITLKPNNSLNI